MTFASPMPKAGSFRRPPTVRTHTNRATAGTTSAGLASRGLKDSSELTNLRYGSRVLRTGDRGEAVSGLQQQLANLGYNPGPIDGVFGARTKAAVEGFQIDNGLMVDGVVGIQTNRSLEGAARAGSALLAAPGSLGTTSKRVMQNLKAGPPTPLLRAEQVDDAIKFNKKRFKEAESIQTFQSIVGAPVTGVWDEDTVQAVAAYQETAVSAGDLDKVDGKIGDNTYTLIDTKELPGRLPPPPPGGRMPISLADCPVSFAVDVGAPTLTTTPGFELFGFFLTPSQCGPLVPMKVSVLFPSSCGCDRFEYRQEIRGEICEIDKPGDRCNSPGALLLNNNILPGGAVLNPVKYQPDAHLSRRIPGDRRNPPDAWDKYFDIGGGTNQESGCAYRMKDQPHRETDCGQSLLPWIPPGTGLFWAFLQFRGTILADGKPLLQRTWIAMHNEIP